MNNFIILVIIVVLGAIAYTHNHGYQSYKPDPTVMSKERRKAIIKRLRRHEWTRNYCLC
jgi:hypothetical protein